MSHYGHQGDAKRQRYDSSGGYGRGGRGYGRGGGGGYHRGGGYGGEFSGRHYGGGRNRGDMWGEQQRPKEILVRTNFFKVQNLLDELRKASFIKYKLHIYDARRMKKKDENGNIVEPWSFLVVPWRDKGGEMKPMPLDRGSSPLSRRILLKLQENLAKENNFFISDLCGMAFSPSRLFECSGVDAEVEETNMEAMKNICHDFKVKVSASCDESDPEHDRTRPSWFIVRFEEVGKIQDPSDLMEEIPLLQMALTTAYKNQLFASRLKVDGRSPRCFYLPNEKCENPDFLGNYLMRAFGRNATPKPLVGISHGVRICQNGQIYCVIDSVLDWHNMEYRNTGGGGGGGGESSREPIPILDPTSNTIAGIVVRNLRSPIRDERLQKDIKRALKKLTFHMSYRRGVDEDYEKGLREKMLKEGKTEDEVNQRMERRRMRGSKMSLRNKRLGVDQPNQPAIYWSANDPSLYSFEYTPRNSDQPAERITVAEYYRRQYNIQLKYPDMPILYIRDGKRKGYFPIEFFSQAFGKTRETDYNQHVLKFNDEMSSTQKLNHLQKIKDQVDQIKHQSAPHLEDLLRQLRLDKVDKQPLQLSATVLEQPKVIFHGRPPTEPSDGTWNLHNVTFSKPAHLSSFGVLDFVGDRRSQNMQDLIYSLRGHGVKMPQNFNVLQALNNVAVSVNSRDCGEIYQKFMEAKVTAQRYFLTENRGRLRYGGFLTQVVNEDGEVAEGLVHSLDDNGQKFSVILRSNIYGPTHTIEYRGKEYVVRVNAVVDNGQHIDLFQLRLIHGSDSECFERQCENSGEWKRTRFENKYVFTTHDGQVFDENQVTVKSAEVVVTLDQIDCPSIIFVRLRDDSSEIYNFIKLLSHNIVGTQTQCFLSNKCKAGQYASNIAIKVNTKLASKMTGAKAWTVSLGSMDNSWLQETETMIMGLSLARAPGQDQKTVVAGSVCLDADEYPGIQMAQAVRIQTTSGIIERSSIEHLTMSLATQYWLHNNKKFPNRILVYRNGSSEGSFKEILQCEVFGIRRSLYNLQRQLLDDFRCSVCTDGGTHEGCQLCTPIITYVVAVSQHNVRIVPAAETYKKNGRVIMNVPSGTCVNHTITDFFDSEGVAIPKKKQGCNVFVWEPSDYDGFDFLLTAQGGLKGTSKPIFYRTVYNENFVFKPEREDSSRVSQLTKQKLQQLTYSMTFQYGTATKAVRMVPVIKYSVRLANTFISYLPYLLGRQSHFCLEAFQLQEHRQQDKESLFGYKKCSHEGDECIKTEMMEYFSPFSAGAATTMKTPFHPHMMA